MKVSAISNFSNHLYSNHSTKISSQIKSCPLNQTADTIEFEGKGGKILGGILGGAAGGAAGGAIIGGGSLAGMSALIATGPIGLGLAAAYAIGGALAGSYLGSGFGDLFTGDDDKKKPDEN